MRRRKRNLGYFREDPESEIATVFGWHITTHNLTTFLAESPIQRSGEGQLMVRLSGDSQVKVKVSKVF